MTEQTRAVLIDTVYKLARIAAATVVIAAAAFGAVAVFFGLETSTHADTARGMIKADVDTRETEEHADEQHQRLDKRIDAVIQAQGESYGRIEKALERLEKGQDDTNGKLWRLREDLK